MDKLLAWMAPIATTLVTLAGQLWLNGRFKLVDQKRDAVRAGIRASRGRVADSGFA